MNRENILLRLLTSGGVAIWLILIVLPLITLYAWPQESLTGDFSSEAIISLTFRSASLAAALAVVAVILGYIPARLLGRATSGKGLLLFLLLIPLLLPRYVLYYAWSLLLSPTSPLGGYISSRPELAQLAGNATSWLVIVLWYWPLAALVIAQGWRKVDAEVLETARLETGCLGSFFRINLPLLRRSMCLAWGVCFVLIMSEFGTFHLAGVRTVGTELAVLYELTGSETFVANSAWPLIIPAVVLAIVLGRHRPDFSLKPPTDRLESSSNRWRWVLLLALMSISLLMPLLLLICHVTDAAAFKQFLKLHTDGLLWSLIIAACASLLAIVLGFSALILGDSGRFGLWVSGIMRAAVMLVLFLPGSLIAISLLKAAGISGLSLQLRQSWLIVSVGQAVRFAGIALIIIQFARDGLDRHLRAMAAVDQASRLQAWRFVHFPRTWPLLLGAFLLVTMFGLTELPATMVLLPAGLPNFAQRLLNQMHYARDQQVVASCLMLVAVYLLLASAAAGLWHLLKTRSLAVILIVILPILLAGCRGGAESETATVLDVFGQAGRAPGKFAYPRAIDIRADGSVYVVDKTGRIQRFTRSGEFLDAIALPVTDAGFPTGLSVGPDGNLYVADTHYHRVLVFSPGGELLRQFGRFGQTDGCFIYPTDVAFAEDGRIYVSEYGGNDRISVFSVDGEFLHTFGSFGSDSGQLSRPSAICIDQKRSRLYVADACNHRLAVYDLDGNLLHYIGSAGTAPGQLRYPYDLALADDGTIVVCEYGNNRLQLFSPDGRSLATYGGPGRGLGQLAYPWGVALDAMGRAYIIDAGNNRVQIWDL